MYDNDKLAGAAMKRYAVALQCMTSHPKIRRAYGQEGFKIALVFAGTPGGAKRAAIEKMQDKWLRHQNLATEWEAFKAWES